MDARQTLEQAILEQVVKDVTNKSFDATSPASSVDTALDASPNASKMNLTTAADSADTVTSASKVQ